MEKTESRANVHSDCGCYQLPRSSHASLQTLSLSPQGRVLPESNCSTSCCSQGIIVPLFHLTGKLMAHIWVLKTDPWEPPCSALPHFPSAPQHRQGSATACWASRKSLVLCPGGCLQGVVQQAALGTGSLRYCGTGRWVNVLLSYLAFTWHLLWVAGPGLGATLPLWGSASWGEIGE